MIIFGLVDSYITAAGSCSEAKRFSTYRESFVTTASMGKSLDVEIIYCQVFHYKMTFVLR